LLENVITRQFNLVLLKYGMGELWPGLAMVKLRKKISAIFPTDSKSPGLPGFPKSLVSLTLKFLSL